ncbi:hypothetical protein [Mucilaginibacter mallensis]|uniref:hypothetical protein n=1 Tax=Mucilaginibacter mallensis TaxID=652787 RepID=UPI001E51ECA3
MRKYIYIPAFLGALQTDLALFDVFLYTVIIILSVLSLFVILMGDPIAGHYLL